ncbi:CPBP family intramembrane metalloprotease [bacterium]|nr:CPBP family intramembrane metalloprotease [bacterium]MBU1072706.1 CPBP family intramembrane metalloprotease [bacterium]MBU1677124.1 CPBP family intramembrane metalloprotease [bacterium]
MTDPDHDRPEDRVGLSHPVTIWSSWSTVRLTMMAVLWSAANLVAQTVTYTYTGDMFAAVGTGGLLVLALAVLVVRGQNGSLSRDFDLDRPPLAKALLAVLAAVAALLPTSYLAGVSSSIHPPSAEWIAFFNEHLPATTPRIAVAVVAVTICGPVAEELVFRGLVFRIGRRHWRFLPSALISALVFGLAHGEPWFLFGLVGLGVLLAHIYEQTGSLTACILTHSAHNGISLAFMLIQGGAIEQTASETPVDWLGLAGSCIALAAIIFLYSRRRP